MREKITTGNPIEYQEYRFNLTREHIAALITAQQYAILVF